MRHDTQDSREDGEPVHEPEEEVHDDDGVDQPRQKPLGHDGVLLHQLREVVQPRRDGQREEAEPDERAGVADQGENPHGGRRSIYACRLFTRSQVICSLPLSR